MATHRTSFPVDTLQQQASTGSAKQEQQKNVRPASITNSATTTGSLLTRAPSIPASAASLSPSSSVLLRFHPTKHGDNVQISADGRIAHRLRGYCRSLVISRHPVPPLRFLFLRLRRFDSAYHGMLRFGWTVHAPEGLNDAVVRDAKYLVPDTVDAYSGWWGGALSVEMQSAILRDPNMRENAIIYLFRQLHGPTFVGLLSALMLSSGGIASAQASLSILSQRSKNNVPDTTLPGGDGAYFVMDLYGETSQVEVLDPSDIFRMSGSNTNIGFDWHALALNLIRQYALHQQQQNANHQLAHSLMTMTNNINTINTAVQPSAGGGLMRHNVSSAELGSVLVAGDTAERRDHAPPTPAQRSISALAGLQHLEGSSEVEQKATDFLLSLRRLSLNPSHPPPTDVVSNNDVQQHQQHANTPSHSGCVLLHPPPRPAAPLPLQMPAGGTESSFNSSCVSIPMPNNNDTRSADSPISFHAGLSGCNVTLRRRLREAHLSQPYFCYGHIFSNRPVALEERIYLQILEVACEYTGSLGFGVTSADPALLDTAALPADINRLLDRSEYWVVVTNLAERAQPNDVMTFCIRRDGQVQVAGPSLPVQQQQQQQMAFRTVFHVDTSRPLHMLFSLYGTTRRVRLLAAPPSNLSRVSSDHRVDCRSSSHQQQNRTNEALMAPNNNSANNNYVVQQPPGINNIPIANSSTNNGGNITIAFTPFTRQAAAALIARGALNLQARAANSRVGRVAAHALAPLTLGGGSSADTADGAVSGGGRTITASIGNTSVITNNNNSNIQRQVSTSNNSIRPPLNNTTASTPAPRLAPPPPSPSRTNNGNNMPNQMSPFTRRGIHARRTSTTSNADGEAAVAGAAVPVRNNYISLNNFASPYVAEAVAGNDADTRLFVGAEIHAPGAVPPAPRLYPRLPPDVSGSGAPLPPPSLSVVRARPTPSSMAVPDVVPRAAVPENNNNASSVAAAASPRMPPSSSGASAVHAASSLNECCVCLDRDIDCVLYRCGHMCMCAVCAYDTLERSGVCPICRSDIVEVIKTYRS